MLVIATSQLDPAREAERQQLLSAEAQGVRDVAATGVVRAMYWKADNSGAVFVLEVADEDAARAALAGLPLVQRGITRFSYTPVVPLQV